AGGAAARGQLARRQRLLLRHRARADAARAADRGRARRAGALRRGGRRYPRPDPGPGGPAGLLRPPARGRRDLFGALRAGAGPLDAATGHGAEFGGRAGGGWRHRPGGRGRQGANRRTVGHLTGAGVATGFSLLRSGRWRPFSHEARPTGGNMQRIISAAEILLVVLMLVSGALGGCTVASTTCCAAARSLPGCSPPTPASAPSSGWWRFWPST